MAKVAIVIAAYNEQDNIREIVTEAKRHGDVIVVDDASKDDTSKIARMAGARVITHETNTHIRQAFMDGFSYALSKQYDAIIQMDAGHSHDPEQIPDLLYALRSSDYVIGTRIKTKQKFGRWLLSRTASFLIRRIMPFKDPTGGFKAYRPEVLSLRHLVKAKKFAFQFEFTYHIFRHGYRIAEVPITYKNTGSSLNFSVIWEALKTYIRLLFMSRFDGENK